jgi:hypothetical protein
LGKPHGVNIVGDAQSCDFAFEDRHQSVAEPGRIIVLGGNEIDQRRQQQRMRKVRAGSGAIKVLFERLRRFFSSSAPKAFLST